MDWLGGAPAWFLAIVSLVAVGAGATASVVGFGIGSLLTPLLASRYGMDTAIAAVALPHFAGGLLRGWRLRRAIDWPVLLRFGACSAAGGLVGAFVFGRLAPPVLGRVLGALLLLTAAAGLSGWSSRWRPHGALVWVLGGLSGFCGGVVGNQGGLRAAALASFGLAPAAFVATSTVTGIAVDVARTPVYLIGGSERLAPLWGTVALVAAGVLAGTLLGERLLLGLSPGRFRKIVSAAIGILGVWLLVSGSS